ncbi:MAG: tRNA (guanosine(37)-N1)-methyltransferase TrmD [Christensenellales bacterium]|jgi:tRNA (guanine37-N1)-methyltransferase
MRIDVLTLFPGMFDSILTESMIGRAVQNGILDVRIHNIRDHAQNKHRQADDTPFGGGAGMVMMPQPIFDCFDAVLDHRMFKGKRIYLSPRGKRLNNSVARKLAKEEELILLCGHYEGVDQRVIDELIDFELSIGDYVTTGGELPAMVLIDCVARHIPGVLGSAESAQEESFEAGLLEYPHYTRPYEYRGMKVPEVLISGHHAKIEAWRRKQAIKITYRNRPDLIAKLSLDDAELKSIIDEDYIE